MPHECCARRLLQTRNVGVMCLCCQKLKHGRVGFRLKQRSVKSTAMKKKRQNKLNCCFPLRDDEDCCGNLVSYPRRLFPVFDCYKNPNKGTLICEAHLKLADKDKRICNHEAYTLPKKVRHWHFLILPSPGSYFAQQNHLWASMTTSPAHRHTPKTHPQSQLYLFDQRSSSQSTNSTSPNPDKDQLIMKIEELENAKKKIGRRTKKSR